MPSMGWRDAPAKSLVRHLGPGGPGGTNGPVCRLAPLPTATLSCFELRRACLLTAARLKTADAKKGPGQRQELSSGLRILLSMGAVR